MQGSGPSALECLASPDARKGSTKEDHLAKRSRGGLVREQNRNYAAIMTRSLVQDPPYAPAPA